MHKEILAEDVLSADTTIVFKPVTAISVPAAPWVTNPYLQAATSQNTRKAYRSDIKHYEKWGGKLPASPEQVVRYLEAYAPTLNSRTLARRLIALRHWHTYQGFSDPTNHPVLQKTICGIKRTHGKPKDKARAITPDELAKISNYLIELGSFSALRDNAVLQIGFFGALRRSELTSIYIEHLNWNDAGVEILLPSSKTDQVHEGQYCMIPYGNHLLCPIQALKTWLEISKIKSGPIFRRIALGNQLGDAMLTPITVNHIIKKRALESGINEITFLSSHSLRRGLATSAARAGAPLKSIMRAGRWKQTNTVMEYIEASERIEDNAAAVVLNLLE